jgi:hypothetical protein
MAEREGFELEAFSGRKRRREHAAEILSASEGPHGRRNSGKLWRRMQSGANLSPREFPANREKYREFLHFWSKFIRAHLISTIFQWSYWKITAKQNRELSGP